MNPQTIDESEIESLKKSIEKIDRKCIWSYIGIALGVIMVLFTLFYYMQNPDIVAGSISLGLIGAVVIALNAITLKQRKNRIEALNKDLKVMEEVVRNQDK